MWAKAHFDLKQLYNKRNIVIVAQNQNKMKKTLHVFIALAVLLGVSSCSTPKNITYFQEQNIGTFVQAAKVLDIKVKPKDKLSIVVSTQDPALSQLFNLVTTQNRLDNISASGNSSSSGQVSYYTVDSQGDINFPVVGKIHIAGLSREDIADKIVKELTTRNLVIDPIVTVEFANTHIAVIGEVASPGRYNFNEDQITIIDAIAMAGDLTINGVRDNILVMRQTEDGKQESYRIDLTNASAMASSPAFYLQQDDVIYVEPNNKKKRETTPNGNTPYTPSFWVSMGSFAVTIATLIITLAK